MSVEVAQALWLLLAALGLAVSVSYAGMPVLGQGAFVAVGGFGTALLGPGGEGLPLGLAVVLAVSAAAASGWVVGLAASRVEGAALALATWGLAWLVHRTLLAFPGTYGGEQGLVRPSPARLVLPGLGLELVLTPAVHVVLAGVLCALVAAALVRADRGPAGLDLAALRHSPALAASLGVPVARRRRAVLTVTAALGGLSGAGTAVLLGLVAPADVSPLLSLQLLVAVLVGGTARWWGPVAGVALLTAVTPVADALARAADLPPERARGVLTAALLVTVLAARAALRRRPANAASADPGAPEVLPGPPPAGPSWRPVLLRAQGVAASYGPRRVLEGVDLVLRGGEVHALVGPNGSGKSTLLAVLAGDLRPDRGLVEVGGLPVTGRDRVGTGVVRTPQRTLVPEGLATARQVAVGARARTPLAVLRHLLGTPSSRAEDRVRARVAAAALAEVGLGEQGDPRRLDAARRRLLQVARARATGAPVLLLDEPAAGAGPVERERLAQVVRALAGHGCAVLLVEHDMRLVAAVADRVTVLDRGTVLAAGTVEAVRDDPAVQAAYLGGAR